MVIVKSRAGTTHETQRLRATRRTTDRRHGLAAGGAVNIDESRTVTIF